MNPVSAPSLSQAIQMPGGGELLLILLIVLVVFGHNRIPQLGSALGQGIRNFKRSMAKEEDAQPQASADESRAEAVKPAEKAQDANKVL